MKESKLGVSVGLLGAAMYFSCYFSGYMLAIIVAGYILLFEESLWLRQTAVKAITLFTLFHITLALVALLGNTMVFVDSVYEFFGKTFYSDFISDLESFIQKGLSLVQKIIFIVLGFKALKQESVEIEIVDNFVSRHMD